jgi:pimeloyl-ACP methyl ester carboxylesterase
MVCEIAFQRAKLYQAACILSFQKQSGRTKIPTRNVMTSFGKTFVRIFGNETAPPLVLLPSGFASSLIWLPNIPGLAPHFRIYAVDNIYDVGRSVNTRPVENAVHLTDWLDELFTELELGDRINIMGLSFGGWLASQYALRHQDRLTGAVLVAPVATVFPLPGEWVWRGIMGVFPPHKCLKIPILFLVGENEVIYSANKAVQRIKTAAPSITPEIIQNASHDLTISQTKIVNSTVVSFLLGIEANIPVNTKA